MAGTVFSIRTTDENAEQGIESLRRLASLIEDLIKLGMTITVNGDITVAARYAVEEDDLTELPINQRG